MFNKIKENYKVVLIVVIFLITIGVLSMNSFKKIKEAKYKINILENQRIELQNKKSKLDLIKIKIKKSTSIIDSDRKAFEQAKKVYEANIWYIECLKAEGQLELKSENGKLECLPYGNLTSGVFNEIEYQKLSSFASYNINKTLIELGLK